MSNIKNVLAIISLCALVLASCNASSTGENEQLYAGPPAAYITISENKQVAERHTTSWTYRTVDGEIYHIDSTVLGISTPSQPLTVTAPFSASLVLSTDIPPDSLGYTIWPVDRSYAWGEDNDKVQNWNFPEGRNWRRAGSELPSNTQQEIVRSDLSKGLHIMMVSATWGNEDFVYYGFLLNI